MAKGKIIAAIDIGSSKITTLVGQAEVEQSSLETRVNILGVSSTESRGVKKGQIVDIEDSVEATIISVEGAERMAGYNISKAFLSVGGGHIESLNSTGVVAVSNPEGEVSSEDVERVIESAQAISMPASREIIHVMPREFTVDGEGGVRDPIGMTGVRLEVDAHMVTASSPALKNLAKTVGEVGVDIEEAVFSGIASSYSTLTETERELGCVLIDIGAGTTSIAAYVDGSLAYSGSIPIGARNVTNDLAIGLRVTLDTAEKIKLDLGKEVKNERETAASRNAQIDLTEYGSPEPKKISKRTVTDGIIRPRLNEIFSMVKLELDRVGLINKVPSGAIVTGGGALTYGMEDAVKKTLGFPVRMAVPNGVGGLIDDIEEPQFACAVGLILYGAHLGTGGETGKSLQSEKFKVTTQGVLGKISSALRDLLP